MFYSNSRFSSILITNYFIFGHPQRIVQNIIWILILNPLFCRSEGLNGT